MRYLARNARSVDNFETGGRIVIRSPELGARKCRASIAYQRPARLHLVGRHIHTNIKILEFAGEGEHWVLELPRSDERYYDLPGGTSSPFEYSLSDLLTKVLFPEQWTGLGRARDIQRVENGFTAIVPPDRGDGVGLRCVITIEGPPWQVRLQEWWEGNDLFCRVQWHDYEFMDGVFVPTRVEAELPFHAAQVQLIMRNMRINLTGVEVQSLRQEGLNSGDLPPNKG